MTTKKLFRFRHACVCTNMLVLAIAASSGCDGGEAALFDSGPDANGIDSGISWVEPTSQDEDEETEDLDSDELAAEPLVWPQEESLSGDVTLFRVATPFGTQQVPVVIQGDLLVQEGDMVVGRLDELRQQQEDDATGEEGDLVAFSNPSARTMRPWPNNTILYEIDPSVRDQFLITAINNAVVSWNEQTSIVLRRRTPADTRLGTSYVNIQHNFLGVCQAEIGAGNPTGDVRRMWLSPDCGESDILHEFGHIAGLQHEQSRPDRDDHIVILQWNIGLFENIAFVKAGIGFGKYDYRSVMHYTPDRFAVNPRFPTMRRIRCGLFDTSEACALGGQAFTPGDTAGLRRIQDGPLPANRTRYRSAATNACLRSTGDHLSPDSPLSTDTCQRTASREWYTVMLGGAPGRFLLTHRWSRLCVNGDGSNETLNACDTSPSASFERRRLRDGSFQLVFNGQCLSTLPNSDDVSLRGCRSTETSQRWVAF